MQRLFGLAVLLLVFVSFVGGAEAANNELRVDPLSQNAAHGASFNVTIVQNVGVATTGAQTSLTFDRNLVQVTSVSVGPDWSGSSVLPANLTAAITQANGSGVLSQVAAFFLPGAGSVPAGQRVFLTIGMQAVPSVSGTSPLTLTGVEVLDENGAPVTTSAVSGAVTVVGPSPTAAPTQPPTPSPTVEPSPTEGPTGTPVEGTPTPVLSPTPAVSPTPTPTPTATPTETPTSTPSPAPTGTPTGTPTATPTPGSPSPTPAPTPVPSPDANLAITPSTITIGPGGVFSVTVMQRADVTTTGAQTDLTFNPSLLEVVSVERGAAYARANLIYGVTPNTGAAAISEANSTGTLKRIAGFFVPGTGSIPAGDAAFLKVNLKAKAGVNGTSALALSGMEMLDNNGETLIVAGAGGQVNVQPGAPTVLGGSSPSGLPRSGGPPPEASHPDLFLIGLASFALLSVSGAALGLLRRRLTEPM